MAQNIKKEANSLWKQIKNKWNNQDLRVVLLLIVAVASLSTFLCFRVHQRYGVIDGYSFKYKQTNLEKTLHRLKEFMRKIAQLKKIDQEYMINSRYTPVLGKDISPNLKDKDIALSICSKKFFEAEVLIKSYEKQALNISKQLNEYTPQK